MNNEVAVRASVEAEITGFEMKPRNLKEAMDFCELMANSELVPNCYQKKPGNIFAAIQMGAELGMGPMRALRCIAVINGRASMWGDDMLAMVKVSPVCEWVHEEESTDQCGVVEAKRKGDPNIVRRTFDLADAKRAGLLGKAGTWQGYTKRMLMLRARGFALRDQFPDVLAGIVSTEEALDMSAPEAEAQEPAPVLTLKDKLKAQVAPSSVLEPTTAEVLGEIDKQVNGPSMPSNPAQAPLSKKYAEEVAGAAATDDPFEPYRARLRTCERSVAAINGTFHAIPPEAQQDCFEEYQNQLRSLKPAKRK